MSKRTTRMIGTFSQPASLSSGKTSSQFLKPAAPVQIASNSAFVKRTRTTSSVPFFVRPGFRVQFGYVAAVGEVDKRGDGADRGRNDVDLAVVARVRIGSRVSGRAHTRVHFLDLFHRRRLVAAGESRRVARFIIAARPAPLPSPVVGEPGAAAAERGVGAKGVFEVFVEPDVGGVGERCAVAWMSSPAHLSGVNAALARGAKLSTNSIAMAAARTPAAAALKAPSGGAETAAHFGYSFHRLNDFGASVIGPKPAVKPFHRTSTLRSHRVISGVTRSSPGGDRRFTSAACCRRFRRPRGRRSPGWRWLACRPWRRRR